MHPWQRFSTSQRLTAAIVAAALLMLPTLFTPASADRSDDERIQALKDLQIELNSEGAQLKRQRLAEKARATLKAHAEGYEPAQKGARAHEALLDDLPLVSSDPSLLRELGTSALLVIPSNVRANNPAGDTNPFSGQAESSIASLGPNILVAWNDGDGFGAGSQAPHTQGYGYSTNGGASYIDGGAFPVPAAFPALVWTSDPVVTVNEKTGDFYYCGLINPTGTTNGIGVIRGNFVGPNIVWQQAVAATNVSNFTNFHDKQWLVADSSNGNLYLSWTDFFSGGNHIRFTRSTDNGLTWSAPIQLSLAGASGFVQGSRPVVGPNGEVYVVWKQIGFVGGLDIMKVRRSLDNGVTFGPEVNAVTYYDNFGTGAPGFNRNRSVSFPSIAVDRTSGPNNGRIYIAYHESYNFYDDPLFINSGQVESEFNGASGSADPFLIGNTLRGVLGSASDQDWFSFSAVAGQHYMFWADSIPTQFYTLRVFCSNGTQLLAFGGDNSGSPGGTSFYTWTAPTTATYFLRIARVAGGAPTGGYRILTAQGFNGAERGRDWRDVFVNHSDDGLGWTTPVRVNDDAARYDGWLPEVIVASDGCPYTMWYDWRDADAKCAGDSHIYVSRTTDGGTTWAANQQATNVQSDWTANFSNIAPNQGDYSHMYGADDFVRWTWADVRGGDPDAFVAGLDTRFGVVCPPDQMGTPGGNVPVTVQINNPNDLFGNTYNYSVSDQRGWPLPANNSLNVAAASSGNLNLSIAVPDTALLGMNEICVTITNAKGTKTLQCCFKITIDQGTPTVLSLADIDADPERVSLTWYSGGDEISSAGVFRRTENSDWSMRGIISQDGNGRLEFVDTDVIAGGRYGYRVLVNDRGRDMYLGEIWVNVPNALQLAISHIAPNPARGDAFVTFSLPADGPAELTVVDVAGRAIRSINLGGFGAGRHQVNLAESGRLPAGMYLIRVSQGGASVTSRISIIR